MHLTYFDTDPANPTKLERTAKKLGRYESEVQHIISSLDDTRHEYALAHAAHPALHDTIANVRKRFGKCKHLVLLGIGGSNLGTEAIHAVVGSKRVTLHTLDTIHAPNIEHLLNALERVKRVQDIVVCVISKSGSTTETLVNAGVLLDALEHQFGDSIYEQTIYIGDPETDAMRFAHRKRMTPITMPGIVGGRYSVATEVGLVPLALLGHDTDAFLQGVTDVTSDTFLATVHTDAARLYTYLASGVTHYNFFAFEPRLVTLGAWYRQLLAESIGKSLNREGKPVKYGCVPTISTPVELHSVGQLYLSGFSGVYTDFVTFDDDTVDYKTPKKGIAKAWGGHTVNEVATALYGGVVGAYQERELPYRSTIFTEDITYSLGLFMGMRMLETMYLAELMNVNAFDQPNVELYKTKTKAILGL